MLESQTRVPQEGDGERRSATDAREPGPKRPAQREDVDRAEVRELAVLDVAPNLLDGIQLWSVARQSFDRHPRPLLSEILPHHAARVPTESVPDHDDMAAWEVALEGAQKADQRKIVVTAGPRLEVAAPTPAIPGKAKAAAIDKRDQLPPVWVKTGGWPRGAQVRRTTGRCETPLSSSKTIQARRRRAFFLPAASARASTARSPPRRARAPAAWDVGVTTQGAAGCTRRDRGGTARVRAARSAWPRAATSTAPSRSHEPRGP